MLKKFPVTYIKLVLLDHTCVFFILPNTSKLSYLLVLITSRYIADRKVISHIKNAESDKI